MEAGTARVTPGADYLGAEGGEDERLKLVAVEELHGEAISGEQCRYLAKTLELAGIEGEDEISGGAPIAGDLLLGDNGRELIVAGDGEAPDSAGHRMTKAGDRIRVGFGGTRDAEATVVAGGTGSRTGTVEQQGRGAGASEPVGRSGAVDACAHNDNLGPRGELNRREGRGVQGSMPV